MVLTHVNPPPHAHMPTKLTPLRLSSWNLFPESLVLLEKSTLCVGCGGCSSNTNKAPWPGPPRPHLYVHHSWPSLVLWALALDLAFSLPRCFSVLILTPSFLFTNLSLVGKQAFFHIAGKNENGTASMEDICNISLNCKCTDPGTSVRLKGHICH